MEETSEQPQETVDQETVAEQQQKPSSSSWEQNKIPLSIVLGSVIIAASIMWSNAPQNGQVSGAITENNSDQSETGSSIDVAAIKSYAEVLEMNTEQFNACLDNGETAAAVGQDLADGQAAGVEGTPTFYINGKQIVGALPYAEFEKVIEDALAGRIPASEQKTVAAREGAHVIGDANAPVTMVEFSDFECPYCQRFMTASYPQIKSKYIDTGKVKIVFRHFPLNHIHPNAQKAAEAAECAGKQGKFQIMHDVLFAQAQQKS